jgi:hypothetical protein
MWAVAPLRVCRTHPLGSFLSNALQGAMPLSNQLI